MRDEKRSQQNDLAIGRRNEAFAIGVALCVSNSSNKVGVRISEQKFVRKFRNMLSIC